MVGRFALGFAVTAPIFLFTNLQLRTILATDPKQQFGFQDYLGLRLVTIWPAFAAVAFAVWLSGYDRETALVVLMVGASKVLDSVSDIICGYPQQRERMDRIAVSAITKGLTSLAALMIVFRITGSLAWGVAAFAASFALVLGGYDIHSPTAVGGSASLLRPRFERAAMLRLVYLALPLGFVMMLISLNLNAPRYFVEHYMGERELGIFAAMAYLTNAGVTVIGALLQSAIPRLAKHHAAGEVLAYRALLTKLVVIGMAVGGAGILAAVLAGHWVLGVIYGPEYARQSPVLVWVSVASGIAFVQSFLDGGMTVARYLRVQIPLFASGMVATCLGCIVLVPRFGLTGAAFAMIIGNSVLALGAVAVNVHILSRLRARADAGSLASEREAR